MLIVPQSNIEPILNSILIEYIILDHRYLNSYSPGEVYTEELSDDHWGFSLQNRYRWESRNYTSWKIPRHSPNNIANVVLVADDDSYTSGFLMNYSMTGTIKHHQDTLRPTSTVWDHQSTSLSRHTYWKLENFNHLIKKKTNLRCSSWGCDTGLRGTLNCDRGQPANILSR